MQTAREVEVGLYDQDLTLPTDAWVFAARLSERGTVFLSYLTDPNSTGTANRKFLFVQKGRTFDAAQADLDRIDTITVDHMRFFVFEVKRQGTQTAGLT